MSSKVVDRLPPIHVSNQNDNGNNRTQVPKYKLPDSNVQYYLPVASALRPYVDTRSGDLDSWPAHAAGKIHKDLSLENKRNKVGAVVPYKPDENVPKPKFLEQLESFIYKELRALDCEESGSGELRLQVYREVFEYLISDFKTYRPILASIKREYEGVLRDQQEQLKQMQPLKQMLVTVSEQCDQKIMDLRDQEKVDVIDLKGENERLYNVINSLNENQKVLEDQIEKLRDSIAEEYTKYKNESDARKILVTEFNELKYHMEQSETSNEAGVSTGVEEEKSDPVIMKIALKKAREDLSRISAQLNEMVANYGDVVPRRDFEILSQEFLSYKDSVAFIKKDRKRLIKEQEALQHVHEQVIVQRNDYYSELEHLKRAATPRPKWKQCANYIDGGTERWGELSKDKSSSDMVNLLLAEISGATLESFETVDNFVGRGFGEDVPQFLRHDGEVKNRFMSKKDLLLVIKDFWKQKLAADGARSPSLREPFNDFLYSFLAGQFGSENIADYGYNIYNSAKMFSFDNEIGSFCKILEGLLDQEVYYERYELNTRLASLIRASSDNATTVKKDHLRRVLTREFPLRAPYNIDKLVESTTDYVESEDNVLFERLFLEEPNGMPSKFVLMLQQLATTEKAEYIDEVMAHLTEQIGDAEEVAANDVRGALISVDPGVTKEKADLILKWVFQCTAAEIDIAAPIEPLQVDARMRSSLSKRFGKVDNRDLKSEVDTKPGAAAKPEEDTKTEGNANPEADDTTEGDANPEADAKPETSVKPETESKPEEDSKPETD